MAYKKVTNLKKEQTVNYECTDGDGKTVAQSFKVFWRVPRPARMKDAVDGDERMVDLMFEHLAALDLDMGDGTSLDAATARDVVEELDDPYLNTALMASFMDASPSIDSFRGKPGRNR